MTDDRFEWDDRKAASNRCKHGVSFKDARFAFDNPAGFAEADEDPDDERWKHFDLTPIGVLVVVYTERNSRTRIISVRQAMPHGHDSYYRQTQAKGWRLA